MRIISGNYKGKSIQYLKSKTTRPLKDSVKENIFNILKHSNKIDINIKNASVLDLYSGIGSFGLECISRGAREVTFVEHDEKALNILKKNLHTLTAYSKANTFNAKSINFLKKNHESKYNIFFLDPPFASNEFIQDLDILKKNKNFKKKNVIIIHRKKNVEDNFGNLFNILFTRVYGKSKIIFGKFS